MRHDPAKPIVWSADQIADLPTEQLGDIAGVDSVTLWTDGASVTGVLTVAAGCRLGRHAHRTHLHHMWVLHGEAVIADQRLGPGSYVHVPPGIDHDIDASETGGVTVYYAYVLPHAA